MIKQELEMIRAIVSATFSSYHLSMGGGGGPAQRDAFECHTKPKPGDLVVETSTAYRRWDNDEELPDSVGRLVNVNPQQRCDDSGEVVAMDTMWQVETFGGKIVDWSNASFITVPDGPWWPKRSRFE